MKNCILPLALQVVLLGTAATKADEITINESRPLGKLAYRLEERYKWLVTYEEAPYSDRELSVATRPNGVHHRFPTWKPVTFHLPELQPYPSATPYVADPDLLHALVSEYNRSGSPGRFDVLVDGEYTHIIPTTRMVDGKYEPFLPVLSTRVLIPPHPHSCYEVFKELFSQIKAVRGFNITGVMLPVNPLDGHRCTIQGADLTARQVLLQLLGEIGAPIIPGTEQTRFTWWFDYDANDDMFFLDTRIVLSKTGAASDAKTSKHAAQKPPATAGHWFDSIKVPSSAVPDNQNSVSKQPDSK